MNKNFCVIDIGTNTVKCKAFVNGKYYTPKNKFFTKQKTSYLNIDEVSKYVSEFISESDKLNIPKSRIYIAATQGLRNSPNADEIIAKIKKETGRQVHVISPEKEALLSVIGGIKPLKFQKPYPKQILFIESGGGSTEISLVNTTKRPPRISATTSIPLGTKKILIDDDIDKTEQFITDKITNLLKQINDKGIKIDPSLEIVINSSAASKIIGKAHNQLNPKIVMQKNLQMKLEDFFAALGKSCDQDIETEYQVHHKKVTGFKNHCYLLGSILMKLRNNSDLNNPSIRTTIDGTKDGLAYEILHNIKIGKSDEEIDDTILSIKDENKETTNKEEKEKEKEKEKEEEEEKNNDANDANKDKIKKAINSTNKISNKDWILNCKNFYTSRHNSYISTQNTNSLISIQDKDNDNELTYISPKEVVLSINKQSKSNRLYEDMIIKAKKDGISSIRFKSDTCLETKLRMYAACKKYNMPILNFIYNPEMLKRVSPQTKQIVEFSTQKSTNYNSKKSR